MANTIRQILDKIGEDRICIPSFQREYVWKRDDVKELFRSLIHGYPTGTLLTWETDNPPELKGNKKYSKEKGAIKLLLDGQQRITSIYIIVNGKYPPYYSENEIKHDIRKLYINLETLELEYYKPTKMKNQFLWVDLTEIFNNKINLYDDPFSNISDREKLKKISDNYRKVENIQVFAFPEQEIPIKANINEAINIFYRVNAMGVNLTEAELALAHISGYWPKARELFKEKINKLKNNGFDFKIDFIIFLLLGIIHTKGDNMRDMHSPHNLAKLKEVWDKLDKKTLDYTVNLLRANFIDSTKEINSVYALVPLITYIYEKERLTEIEIKKAIKWFYYSQVRSRYTSQLPQKLTKDLKLLKVSIKNKENPFDNLLQIIKEERNLEISENEFENASISHPLYNLMKFYFKKNEALSFDGVRISKANYDGNYSLENDHIFPISVLSERGYKFRTSKYSLAQEIANRAIITRKENRTKSNKCPFDYLTNIKENYPTALKLQLIPENEELWKINNYERFLIERRKLLAKELNSFLENTAQTEERERKLSISDLIEKDEDENLEFKSTLSWNIKGRLRDKKIEESVLKTVAGFNNKEGGILLIGVDDASNILGLDDDYNLANLQDRDKFELHLRNIIREHLKIDNGYIAKMIKISFETIDKKDICMIEVQSGTKPIFTKDEKFFLRDGNGTVELQPSEMHPYIIDRFPE